MFAPQLLRSHPLPIALGIGLSSFLAYRQLSHRHVLAPMTFGSLALRCDASPSGSLNAGLNRYQRETQTPIFSRGRINPSAVRQISIGSIAGLCCGLAVGVFSKPLAVILGLMVCGVQALESRGIHIIPYSRLQRFFTNTDLRGAVQNNVALKISFGLTFALSAFAEF